MSDTSDLTVRVLDDRDIVVVMAGTGFEVTYRKDGQLPMLVATDQLRGGVTSSKAKFLAQAWKVAYQKAKTLGWWRADAGGRIETRFPLQSCGVGCRNLHGSTVLPCLW